MRTRDNIVWLLRKCALFFAMIEDSFLFAYSLVGIKKEKLGDAEAPLIFATVVLYCWYIQNFLYDV